MPYLTTVLNGTKTIDSAFNHLEANMFFSGSPFSIDTDDGSDRVNCTSNVIVAQPLFKTGASKQAMRLVFARAETAERSVVCLLGHADFSGHTKTFQNNVALYGACGGSEAGANDHTNIFTGNKCVGAGSPLQSKNGTCQACAQPGTTCPIIS